MLHAVERWCLEGGKETSALHPYQIVGVVTCQNKRVHRGGVVGDADPVAGPVAPVVVGADQRQGAAEHVEAVLGGVVVALLLEGAVWYRAHDVRAYHHQQRLRVTR